MKGSYLPDEAISRLGKSAPRLSRWIAPDPIRTPLDAVPLSGPAQDDFRECRKIIRVRAELTGRATRDVRTEPKLRIEPNGDTWFLARDPAMGLAFVGHEKNEPLGGRVTDINIGAFLNGPRNPEHEALLRLIGNSIAETCGADTGVVSRSRRSRVF